MPPKDLDIDGSLAAKAPSDGFFADAADSIEIRAFSSDTPKDERRALQSYLRRRFRKRVLARLAVSGFALGLVCLVYATAYYAITSARPDLIWSLVVALVLATVGPLVVVFLRR